MDSSSLLNSPTGTLAARIEQSGFGHYVAPFFPNQKIQKLSVSAGTGCPNRDGTIGIGGCTFCTNKAFTPAYTWGKRSITKQLQAGKEFFGKKYKEMQYLAYFQSYTSTHQSTEATLAQYREALAVSKIVGLVISTRPDCMPPDLLKALSKIAQTHFVLIEYGIESTLNHTLKRINRGHTFEQARETILQTAEAGLHVGTHLILGLPGETPQDIIQHAKNLSELPIELIKLHQLQILKGTSMEREYHATPQHFMPLTPESYAKLCLSFVQALRTDIVLDRFVSQSPPELVIAPDWHIKNYQFHHLLLQMAKQLESPSPLHKSTTTP